MVQPYRITISFKIPNQSTYRTVAEIIDGSVTLNYILRHILGNLTKTERIPQEFYNDPQFTQRVLKESIKDGDHYFVKVDQQMFKEWLRPLRGLEANSNFMKQKDSEDTAGTNNKDFSYHNNIEVDDYNGMEEECQSIEQNRKSTLRKDNNETISYNQEQQSSSINGIQTKINNKKEMFKQDVSNVSINKIQITESNQDQDQDQRRLINTKSPQRVERQNEFKLKKGTLPPISSSQKTINLQANNLQNPIDRQKPVGSVEMKQLPIQSYQPLSLQSLQAKEGAQETPCCILI